MNPLHKAAQQALEAMLNFPDDISNTMFESIAALKAALAQQAEPVTVSVDALAQHIRVVDGNHSLGAGALAEKIVEFLIERGIGKEQAEPVLVEGELPPRYVARSPVQAEPMEPVDADAAYQKWLEGTHAPALRRMDSQGAFAAGWQAALAQQAETAQEPVATLIAQRDALLEALKEVLAWGTDQNYVRAKAACDKARAAIKAVEEGK